MAISKIKCFFEKSLSEFNSVLSRYLDFQINNL